MSTATQASTEGAAAASAAPAVEHMMDLNKLKEQILKAEDGGLLNFIIICFLFFFFFFFFIFSVSLPRARSNLAQEREWGGGSHSTHTLSLWMFQRRVG